MTLKQRQTFLVFLAILGLSGCATVMHPGCDGAGQWPANMAFVKLKNAGIVDNSKVVFSRTVVERLASISITNTVYSQVHSVTFFLRSGQSVRVFTVSESTAEECSMGDVAVYSNIELMNSGGQ